MTVHTFLKFFYLLVKYSNVNHIHSLKKTNTSLLKYLTFEYVYDGDIDKFLHFHKQALVVGVIEALVSL